MNERTVARIRELLTLPLYQPIEAPEFAYDNEQAQQPCEERFQLILESFGGALPRRGLMVDFGCNTGWFCREFSRWDWRTIGIDRSPEWLEAAQLLNEELAGKLQPAYIQEDVLKVFETEGIPACNVALCLSVAMYLFDDPAKGWEFFNLVSLAAQIMFFDFGGMYADKVPFTEDEIGELMIANTGFQSWRKLGASINGRSLFVFTR